MVLAVFIFQGMAACWSIFFWGVGISTLTTNESILLGTLGSTIGLCFSILLGKRYLIGRILFLLWIIFQGYIWLSLIKEEAIVVLLFWQYCRMDAHTPVSETELNLLLELETASYSMRGIVHGFCACPFPAITVYEVFFIYSILCISLIRFLQFFLV
ncbi:hypothetical protein [Veillonella criceti]|uniref:Uncharacterized protein n=1 Tax=Veillonella criceti TaxID=103891 RepID=A0A380NL17_9FIRM|nr:hypothetical protein [Veillonella criceti]SUP43046.1 Uncharacterised protein [Veillonella criceti]